ncbi:MAG: PAS domain S-box protein, partial [Ignavibacteria bacterium]|nr:PAS domain S-box protein [Ignavibacteria bacterium]
TAAKNQIDKSISGKLVFDEEYKVLKERIMSSISGFTSQLNNRYKQSNSYHMLRGYNYIKVIFIFALAILIIAAASIFLLKGRIIEKYNEIKSALSSKENSEKLFRSFMDNIPGLAYIKDSSGRIVFTNQGFNTFLNVDPGSVLQKTSYDILPPEFAKKIIEDDKRIISSGIAEEMEERFDEKLWLIHKFPINSDGQDTLLGVIAIDVTEKSKAVNQARKLSRAVYHSPTSIVITNLNGEIEYVNPKFTAVTGYTLEEAKGQNPRILKSDRTSSETYKQLWAAISSGKEWRGELCNKKKNGEFYWEFASISPVLDDEGNITNYVAVKEDITAQKKNLEALRKYSERQTSLVHLLQSKSNNVQHFLDLALEEAIKITSSKIGYIYHYDEITKEFELNTWSKDVMKECRIAEPRTLYQLDKTGIWGEAIRQRKEIVVNDFQSENPLKKGYPEGHAPLKKFLTIPVFQAEQIVAVVGVANKENDYEAQDVESLQLLTSSIWNKVNSLKSEAALRNSEEQLKLAIDGSGAGLWDWEVQTGKLTINEKWAEICGYKLEELMPVSISTWEKLIHPEDFEKSNKLIKYHFEWKTDIYEFEGRMKHKNGNWIWILDRGKVAEYDLIGKPLRMIGTHLDITSRKNAEMQLKKYAEELAESNSTKDKFFSIISHDLRSPFQGFLGLTEILSDKENNFSREEISEISREMNKSAENMLSLLRNLFEWAQIQKGTIDYYPKKFSISDNINSAILIHSQKAAQKNIEIVNESDTKTIVFADERMVNSILGNLIANALKFTEKNGKVICKTKEKDENFIEISIKDTGIGMSSQLLKKLFKISEKTGRKGTEGEESTGLGLILCKDFVRLNKGEIWAESAEGKGSTFYFTLPKG